MPPEIVIYLGSVFAGVPTTIRFLIFRKPLHCRPHRAFARLGATHLLDGIDSRFAALLLDEIRHPARAKTCGGFELSGQSGLRQQTRIREAASQGLSPKLWEPPTRNQSTR